MTGLVPAELGNLSNLTSLYLDNNKLSGELPSEIGNLSGLRNVSLWGNKLTWADHYENGLVADMVALLALYEALNGEGWDRCYRGAILNCGSGYTAGSVKKWLSYQPLGEWELVTVNGGGRVTGLDFSEVLNVRGKLPPELGLLTGLKTLNFQSHEAVVQQSADIKLTGGIPPELGSLSNLEVLRLPSTGLSGSIPAELGKLASLEFLDLWNNGLSGSIPPELGDLSSLEELWLHQNQLTGLVPAELGNLSNLTSLYLDNNKLSGELPSEIGNLSGLRNVSLWGNKLTWADHYENGLVADMVALLALYEALNGEGWDRCYRGAILNCGSGYTAGSVKKWLSYQPLGEWELVTVNGGGRVTGLDFSEVLNVRGKLPPELGLLTGLKTLNFQSHEAVVQQSADIKLTGCIPASLRGIEYTGEVSFC